jgi:hypothetical protein
MEDKNSGSFVCEPSPDIHESAQELKESRVFRKRPMQQAIRVPMLGTGPVFSPRDLFKQEHGSGTASRAFIVVNPVWFPAVGSIQQLNETPPRGHHLSGSQKSNCESVEAEQKPAQQPQEA